MKKLIISLALVLAAGTVPEIFAQVALGPEWGSSDAEKTRMQRNYSFMNETIRNRQYGRAAYYLQELMAKAPVAHVNIYILGGNMYRDRAKAADDKAERMMHLDSLLMMYDLGIEHFGAADPQRRRQFTESKAIDYMNFNPLDRAGIATHFRTAIEELGNEVEPRVILAYFNELTTDYQNDDVSMEVYLMEFDRLTPLVETLGTGEQVRQIQSMISVSGAANCENLEKIYAARVEADPGNVELLETVVTLLNRAGCTGTAFYLKTAELYYKVKPSGQTAIIIATYYMEMGQTATALRYFNEALNIATDAGEKSQLSTNVALLQLNEHNYRDAYTFASRAAQADPKNPNAYYIMGMAQANAAKTVQDDFARQTAYWLVVDNLQQARTLAIANPASKLSVSEVSNTIAQFQTGFPSVEDLFFHGMNDGEPYTVSAGWITGQTTVRKRP